ncbi:MAG: hypothetical protein GY822_03995 [Deltaproteobacteria bacterium]|nr:hypothetical protein [Deltaproteobacteria bacterium]
MAQTLEAGVIRETEVLFFDLRDDGQLDFAAFSEAGDLMDRSEFASASGKRTAVFMGLIICAW